MVFVLEATAQRASFQGRALKNEAHKEAERRLGTERDRQRGLMAVNPSVTQADVDAADRLLKEVAGHIAAAELRVDAVRLVIMGRMATGYARV